MDEPKNVIRISNELKSEEGHLYPNNRAGRRAKARAARKRGKGFTK